jgi:hypothetical protein
LINRKESGSIIKESSQRRNSFSFNFNKDKRKNEKAIKKEANKKFQK